MNARTDCARWATAFVAVIAIFVTIRGDLVTPTLLANPQLLLLDNSQSIGLKVGEKTDVLLTIAELPKSSTLATGFDLDNRGFANLALSPSQKFVIFTAVGKPHCWIGMFDRDTKTVTELAFLFEGAGGPATWAPNGVLVAVETTPASGVKSVIVFSSVTRKPVSLPLLDRFAAEDAETYAPVWKEGSIQITVRRIGHDPEYKIVPLPVSAAKSK